MPISDFTPDVAAVGAILRARTKSYGGQEMGTFMPAASDESDRTRPTAEQVQEMIDIAVSDVQDVFGDDVASTCTNGATRTATLGAAMLVELSYFPEQVATGRSPYTQLEKQYEAAWKRMEVCTGLADPDDGDGLGAGSGYPSYGGFPTTAIGMEFPW